MRAYEPAVTGNEWTAAPGMTPLRQLRPGRVLTRLSAAGLAVVVGVGSLMAFEARQSEREEATESIRQIAAVTARGVVEPRLGDVLGAEPSAVARFDEDMRRYVLQGSLVRVKLLTEAGLVVYSDETRLIGNTFPMEPPQRDAVRLHRAHALVSDPRLPENRYEADEPGLLEVYVGVQDPHGQLMLFEAYFHDDSAGRFEWAALRRFGPPALGGLVLLHLVQVGAVWGLLQRHRRDRDRVALHVFRATAAERRRVAADLHDGVVADLTGLSYELDASGRAAVPGTDLSTVVASASVRLRSSVERLRSLLVNLYPHRLATRGLPDAVENLADTARRAGIDVAVDVGALGGLPDGTAAVLVRAVEEALRNAIVHSGASGLTIVAERADGTAVVEVSDDGRGFDPGAAAAGSDEGHIGLRLLSDLVGEAGGRLVVSSRLGAGTTVRVEVPTR